MGLTDLDAPRLRLRGLRAGDEEFLAALDSDPRVMQHIHDGVLTPEQAMKFARVQIQSAEWRSNWGKWIAELRGESVAVGWVEVGRLRGPRRDDLQVGYELAPEYWGFGYATEAVRRLLEYLFDEVKLDRVAAIARPENTPSLRVLEKLGFLKVGRRKDEGRQWCNEYRVAAKRWRRLQQALGEKSG